MSDTNFLPFFNVSEKDCKIYLGEEWVAFNMSKILKGDIFRKDTDPHTVHVAKSNAYYKDEQWVADSEIKSSKHNTGYTPV